MLQKLTFSGRDVQTAVPEGCSDGWDIQMSVMLQQLQRHQAIRIIQLHYNLWYHRGICSLFLTKASLCSTQLYEDIR